MKTIIILFVLFSINLLAEDVYLKNGTIYFNVKIIERNDTFITITMNEGRSNISLTEIDRIIETPFNPKIISSIKQGTIIYKEPEIKTDPNKTIISQKHFLIVSVLAGLVAWDSFSEASQLQKDEDKTRKTIIGVVSAIGCAAALYFSFQDVVIKVNPNQLSLSYNF